MPRRGLLGCGRRRDGGAIGGGAAGTRALWSQPCYLDERAVQPCTCALRLQEPMFPLAHTLCWRRGVQSALLSAGTRGAPHEPARTSHYWIGSGACELVRGVQVVGVPLDRARAPSCLSLRCHRLASEARVLGGAAHLRSSSMCTTWGSAGGLARCHDTLLACTAAHVRITPAHLHPAHAPNCRQHCQLARTKYIN